MPEKKSKPNRVDLERELYRSEVFENRMHNIYGTPVVQQPMSLFWVVLAISAVAVVYYFFFMSQYAKSVSARVVDISESGVAIVEVRVGLDEFQRNMTTTGIPMHYGPNLEQVSSVEILSRKSATCIDNGECSQIVVSVDSESAVAALEKYPVIAIELSQNYLYEDIL